MLTTANTISVGHEPEVHKYDHWLLSRIGEVEWEGLSKGQVSVLQHS